MEQLEASDSTNKKDINVFIGLSYTIEKLLSYRLPLKISYFDENNNLIGNIEETKSNLIPNFGLITFKQARVLPKAALSTEKRRSIDKTSNPFCMKNSVEKSSILRNDICGFFMNNSSNPYTPFVPSNKNEDLHKSGDYIISPFQESLLRASKLKKLEPLYNKKNCAYTKPIENKEQEPVPNNQSSSNNKITSINEVLETFVEKCSKQVDNRDILHNMTAAELLEKLQNALQKTPEKKNDTKVLIDSLVTSIINPSTSSVNPPSINHKEEHNTQKAHLSDHLSKQLENARIQARKNLNYILNSDNLKNDFIPDIPAFAKNPIPLTEMYGEFKDGEFLMMPPPKTPFESYNPLYTEKLSPKSSINHLLRPLNIPSLTRNTTVPSSNEPEHNLLNKFYTKPHNIWPEDNLYTTHQQQCSYLDLFPQAADNKKVDIISDNFPYLSESNDSILLPKMMPQSNYSNLMYPTHAYDKDPLETEENVIDDIVDSNLLDKSVLIDSFLSSKDKLATINTLDSNKSLTEPFDSNKAKNNVHVNNKITSDTKDATCKLINAKIGLSGNPKNKVETAPSISEDTKPLEKIGVKKTSSERIASLVLTSNDDKLIDIPKLTDKTWEYIDFEGNIQGPFDSYTMSKWWEDNFFEPHLQMRYSKSAPFLPFHKLYPPSLSKSIIPFSSFPAVTISGNVIQSTEAHVDRATRAAVITHDLCYILGIKNDIPNNSNKNVLDEYNYTSKKPMETSENNPKPITQPTKNVWNVSPPQNNNCNDAHFLEQPLNKNTKKYPFIAPSKSLKSTNKKTFQELHKYKAKDIWKKPPAIIKYYDISQDIVKKPQKKETVKKKSISDQITKIKKEPAQKLNPVKQQVVAEKPQIQETSSTTHPKTSKTIPSIVHNNSSYESLSSSTPWVTVSRKKTPQRNSVSELKKSAPPTKSPIQNTTVTSTATAANTSTTTANVNKKKNISNKDRSEIKQLIRDCNLSFDDDMIEFLYGFENTQSLIDFLKDSVADTENLVYFATEFIGILKNPFTTVSYNTKSIIKIPTNGISDIKKETDNITKEQHRPKKTTII